MILFDKNITDRKWL